MNMSRCVITVFATLFVPLTGCMHYVDIARSPGSDVVYVAYSKFLGPSGILTCMPRNSTLRCVDAGPVIVDELFGNDQADEYTTTPPPRPKPQPQKVVPAVEKQKLTNVDEQLPRDLPLNCQSDEMSTVTSIDIFDEPSMWLAERVLICWTGSTVTVISSSGRTMSGTVLSACEERPHSFWLQTVAGPAVVDLGDFARIDKQSTN